MRIPIITRLMEIKEAQLRLEKETFKQLQEIMKGINMINEKIK